MAHQAPLSEAQQSVAHNLEAELPKFRHRLRTRVRSYDVNGQGIVHNAVYFYWLEAARVEYFRSIGLPLDRETFVTKHRFVVAHQDIDFMAVAEFDDEYEIYTRVSYVKNSSFGFEQIIRLVDGRFVVKASSILVQLNPATGQPEHLRDAYRNLLHEYEQNNVQFVR